MEKIITLALAESLHKRIAYLQGDTLIPLADFAKTNNKSIHALLNAARRQTPPRFSGKRCLENRQFQSIKVKNHGSEN